MGATPGRLLFAALLLDPRSHPGSSSLSSMSTASASVVPREKVPKWHHFDEVDVLARTASSSSSNRHLEEGHESSRRNYFRPELLTKEEKSNGGVLLYVFGMFYALLAIAITCDEVLVPAVEVLSTRWDIHPGTTAATLIAMASGSVPEICASSVGTLVAETHVGTGMIVGSVVFRMFFLVGSIGLSSFTPPELSWWPALRDSMFCMLAALMLVVFVLDEQIDWYESASLLLVYIVYCLSMRKSDRIEALLVAKFGWHSEKFELSDPIRPTRSFISVATESEFPPVSRQISEATDDRSDWSGMMCGDLPSPRIAPQPGLSHDAEVPSLVNTLPVSSHEAPSLLKRSNTFPCCKPRLEDSGIRSIMGKRLSLQELKLPCSRAFPFKISPMHKACATEACESSADDATDAASTRFGSHTASMSNDQFSMSALPSNGCSSVPSSRRSHLTTSTSGTWCSSVQSTSSDYQPSVTCWGNASELEIPGLNAEQAAPSTASAYSAELPGSASAYSLVPPLWRPGRNSCTTVASAASAATLQSKSARPIGSCLFSNGLAAVASTLIKGGQTSSAGRMSEISMRGKGENRSIAAEESLYLGSQVGRNYSQESSLTPSVFSMPDESERNLAGWVWWLLLLPLRILLYLSVPDVQREGRERFYVLALFISLFWVVIFTYFCIWCSLVASESFGMSTSLMGIVALSVAACVPEFITGVMMAKRAMGSSAIMTCVGSNVFELTVGLSVPWLIRAAWKGGEALKASGHFFEVTFPALLVVIVVSFVVLRCNRFVISKATGFGLFFLYGLFITQAVFVEMKDLDLS